MDCSIDEEEDNVDFREKIGSKSKGDRTGQMRRWRERQKAKVAANAPYTEEPNAPYAEKEVVVNHAQCCTEGGVHWTWLGTACLHECHFPNIKARDMLAQRRGQCDGQAVSPTYIRESL